MKKSIINTVFTVCLIFIIMMFLGATCTINPGPIVVTYTIHIQNFSNVDIVVIINNGIPLQIPDNNDVIFTNLALNTTIRIETLGGIPAVFDTLSLGNGLILPDVNTYYVNALDGSITGNEFMTVQVGGTVSKTAILSESK